MRVRLTRIDSLDLNLFDFDYDLTFAVFFLSAEEKVYGRYGGRDGEGPDRLQSLAGLHYTMKSVLRMHERAEKVFAPKSQETPKFIRDIAPRGIGRDCMHCHHVREVLDSSLRKAGKWSADLFWRYPFPENVGLQLEIDRGNVVKEVKDKTPASAAGMKAGDVVRRLNGVPVHSLADAQYALERAPKAGSIDVIWERDAKVLEEKLALQEGWRKTDISWRPSRSLVVPTAPVYGKDLSAEEKKTLGLSAKQLAFRQRDYVLVQAQQAGIRPGDIVVGIDDKALEMGVEEFHRHVKAHYLVGDRVTIQIIRDGKRMNLEMKLPR